MKKTIKTMSNEDLKHAAISLVMGVLITAASSLIMGLAHLLLSWVSAALGGVATTVTYLSYKNLV